MRCRNAVPALAIGGVLALGGCGGGDDATTSAQPAKAKSDEAMRHGEAMKDDGGMKHGEAMHDDSAMKDDGSMHDQAADRGDAMKDDSKEP